MSDWCIVESPALERDTLEALLDNEIAAVRVPHLIDASVGKLAVKGIYEHGFDFYADVHPSIGKVGITQFEARHSHQAMVGYFADASHAIRLRSHILRFSGDLFELVFDRVRSAWGGHTALAVEVPGDRPYFAGLVREIEEALLHMDWAPHDAPGWSIGRVRSQLAWNVYCQVSHSGGQLRIFNRPWTADAEQLHVPGSYGYDPALVDQHDFVTIEPQAGDFVAFNSRNFHAVLPTEPGPERVTLGSFIGRLPNDELVLWS